MAFSTSDRGTLDELVLQRGHAQRPLPAVGLGDVHPANRLGPVRPALQPFREVLEVRLQVLPVLLPRLPVHARCGVPLEAEVRLPERVRVVDVVQERGEPQLPILPCSLTYPLQRLLHAVPALCPERVLLSQVPFGRSPSLRPLRASASGAGSSLCPAVVRGLRRYYGTVRLPMFVHHRRASLDFPTRPATPSAAGEHGISRFSREVFPHMHGVSDRAGSRRVSR